MPMHPFDFDVCSFGSINVDYIVSGPAGDPYFDELSEGEERAVHDAAELHEHIDGLDEGRWLEEDLPVVTADALGEAGRVFRALQVAPRRLTLAAERLSAAMLREREADRILDLCIGLEAVLGDPSPGETTYKLSLRAAAVLADAGHAIAPADVFREVKAIYRFRSDIAHGRDPARRRTLRREDVDVATVDAARDYLRQTIAALCDRAQLAEKPERLDQELILAAIRGLSER